jgi:predicted nucleic acid-binding protein
MRASYVVDASVVAKLYFLESGSALAQSAVRRADQLIAPDLLFLEMANLAANKVRRSICDLDQGRGAVHSLGALLDEVVAAATLAPRAFELAVAHGFSAYDAAYIALAESRKFEVLTADRPLVGLARKAGLGGVVRFLE